MNLIKNVLDVKKFFKEDWPEHNPSANDNDDWGAELADDRGAIDCSEKGGKGETGAAVNWRPGMAGIWLYCWVLWQK